jgi:hypothetical protein
MRSSLIAAIKKRRFVVALFNKQESSTHPADSE